LGHDIVEYGSLRGRVSTGQRSVGSLSSCDGRAPMLIRALRSRGNAERTLFTLAKARLASETAFTRTIESFNNLTGLSVTRVDELKQGLVRVEDQFHSAKQELVKMRREFEDAVNARSKVQSEINSLLQRKHDWNATDVTRCTECYTKEHSLKLLEESSKKSCLKHEQLVDSLQTAFLGSLRNVYQEETSLSQKSKILNSYFTWGLILLNSSIFLISTLFIEPQKRREQESRLKEAIVVEHKKQIAHLAQILKETAASPTHEDVIDPTPTDPAAAGGFEEEEKMATEDDAQEIQPRVVIQQSHVASFFLGGAVAVLVSSMTG